MEEQALKFEEKLKTLVALGKKKKNVLEVSEINEVFSDMPLEEEQMEKIYEYLEAQNVDVLRITEDHDEPVDDVELLLSDEEVEDVGKHNAGNCFPPEVEYHVAKPEIPFFGNHDNGRCCKVCKGAAYRYVDKQQGKCGVAQSRAGLELVYLLAQQDGCQCHGGRLGDEGAQQRRNAQYGKPPGCRCALAQRRAFLEGYLCQTIDGPRCRNDHHYRYKQCLGEHDIVVDVLQEVI